MVYRTMKACKRGYLGSQEQYAETQEELEESECDGNKEIPNKRNRQVRHRCGRNFNKLSHAYFNYLRMQVKNLKGY